MLSHSFKNLFALLLALLACGAFGAGDSSSYFEKKSQGWYWYKDPPLPEAPEEAAPIVKKNSQPKKEKEAAQKESEKMFSIQWLKENFEKIQEDAMEHPEDRKKVQLFLYSQRILLDKAQRFAYAAYDEVKMNPLLDESNRMPIDGPAAALFDHRKLKSQRAALEHIAKSAGIWMFYDSRCMYCMSQYTALKSVKNNTNFIVKFISVDGRPLPGMKDGEWLPDKGAFKALNLKITPTTLLVIPPGKMFVISNGSNSAETIYEKIILSAKSENMIPAEYLEGLEANKRGLLTDSDVKDLGNDMSRSEPASVIETIKEKLEKRY